VLALHRGNSFTPHARLPSPTEGILKRKKALTVSLVKKGGGERVKRRKKMS